MQSISLGPKDLRTLYGVGAVATILQLGVITVYMVVVGILGPRITSAEEYYLVMKSPTHFQVQNPLITKGRSGPIHHLYNTQWLTPFNKWGK